MPKFWQKKGRRPEDRHPFPLSVNQAEGAFNLFTMKLYHEPQKSSFKILQPFHVVALPRLCPFPYVLDKGVNVDKTYIISIWHKIRQRAYGFFFGSTYKTCAGLSFANLLKISSYLTFDFLHLDLDKNFRAVRQG